MASSAAQPLSDNNEEEENNVPAPKVPVAVQFGLGLPGSEVDLGIIWKGLMTNAVRLAGGNEATGRSIMEQLRRQLDKEVDYWCELKKIDTMTVKERQQFWDTVDTNYLPSLQMLVAKEEERLQRQKQLLANGVAPQASAANQ